MLIATLTCNQHGIKRGAHERFVLTGSHQPLLKETVSQSLAGRSAFLKLLPLDFSELKTAPNAKLSQDALILRGGMPELYFTETGVAACLQGLKTEEQVSRDPLRGSLFENLVASDILKRNLNRDAEGELYFFRTNDGLEIDLLRQTDDGLQPIEIKSSTTWSKCLSSRLEKYLKLIPGAIHPSVVYGGKSIPAGIDGIDACNFLDFT